MLHLLHLLLHLLPPPITIKKRRRITVTVTVTDDLVNPFIIRTTPLFTSRHHPSLRSRTDDGAFFVLVVLVVLMIRR